MPTVYSLFLPGLLVVDLDHAISGLPLYVVNALVETLGALRRSEYAYVSDAVERVSGCKPRNFEAWCRDHLNAFQ
jgi:hypothetical protein